MAISMLGCQNSLDPLNFSQWSREVRDIDVRIALRSRLYANHKADPDTRIVEEMGIWSGSVRIDVAVINGELAGYEIKSEHDTLERLPTQAEIFSRSFDRMTLVVGAKHAKKANAIIPKWWGIIIAKQTTAGLSLSDRRSAKINPRPDPMMVARLLWKDEAVNILRYYNLDRGFKSKPAEIIYGRLAAELPYACLSQHVCDTLKARTGWLGKKMGS